MHRGRITIGASIVGSFDVDGNDLHVHFDHDAHLRLNKKVSIVFTDGCSLEEAIDRVSALGLTLSLDYPSVYAVGGAGKNWHDTYFEDHKS